MSSIRSFFFFLHMHGLTGRLFVRSRKVKQHCCLSRTFKHSLAVKTLLVFCVKGEGWKTFVCKLKLRIYVAVNRKTSASEEHGALKRLVNVFVRCVCEDPHVNMRVDGCSYLVYSRERGAGWGKGVVDEEKERLLRSQRHTLTDQEAQLAH